MSEKTITPYQGPRSFLSPAEVAKLTPAILEQRAKDLRPLIAAEAAEAERLRRPTDKVWQALRDAGFFYLFVPRAYGGLEGTMEDYLNIILPLAEADASIGWVTAFYMEKNLVLGQYPKQAQDEIFGEFPYINAVGVATPGGELTPVEGGYRLTGRYSWATGIMHADWVVAAGVDKSGPEPVRMTCILPVSDVTIVDTWHVDGMCATGSHDLRIDDVFVPAHRMTRSHLERPDLEFRNNIHDSPIYRTPKLSLLTLVAGIGGIGTARGLIRHYVERMQKRVIWGTTTTQIERPAALIRLGLAESKAQTAELMLRDAARALTQAGENWQTPDPREYARIKSQVAHATHMALDSTRTLGDAGGTSAHYLSNSIQRTLRDMTVLSTHFVFDLDGTMEARGRTMIESRQD